MISRLVILTLALGLAGPDLQAQKKAGQKKGEWASGVAYTTDWKEAIKAVGQSGKMLFIYNGWEGRGI